MAAKNLDNRVNRDAAKNIKANAAEEAILSLMLIFDNLRAEVASGKHELSADDFLTDFGRRVFIALCDTERSESGFSKAMLGQHFNVDELGKLEELEQTRRKYTKNDSEALLTYIANLKEEKKNAENEGDFNYILQMKRAAMQKKKNT